MKTDCLVLGEFETNCYVVRRDESGQQCVVIDPGLGADKLLRFLEAGELAVAAVILTHGHIDHIAAVDALWVKYPSMRLYVHEDDAALLSDPLGNLSAMMGVEFVSGASEKTVRDGDTIEEAGLEFLVLHTPGHTPGGMCLYCEGEGVVFAGDTLFAAGVGRTDFRGGSMGKLVRSIKEKLFTLSDETAVYSGHGPQTTIGSEKEHNPFVH
jgi:glyoxylase-like metal-dependent hydrolase (beta-lactamase superfamily II)